MQGDAQQDNITIFDAMITGKLSQGTTICVGPLSIRDSMEMFAEHSRSLDLEAQHLEIHKSGKTVIPKYITDRLRIVN
jgi:hypothetical protein